MKSGIYQITNTINGKFYIGSAKDIDWRWTEHKRDRGWRWGCGDCGQEWREPRIMSYPEFGDIREVVRPKYLEVTEPCLEESEFPDGFIRKYK